MTNFNNQAGGGGLIPFSQANKRPSVNKRIKEVIEDARVEAVELEWAFAKARKKVEFTEELTSAIAGSLTRVDHERKLLSDNNVLATLLIENEVAHATVCKLIQHHVSGG